MDLAGKKFGNYRAVSLLGEGGFGSVYLAEHPLMARKAAVKVLRAARAADMEFLNRFFNEARAASAINHPNIVEIFDAGVTEDGTPYLLMELLRGETLKDRITREGPLPRETALAFAADCASALAAAHRAGIVHRDFKPENVFLVEDSNPRRTGGRPLVKVLDFGIAKLTGFETANVVRTEVGSFMGSPRYVSPEQWLATREVDHRTDIYALAVVLFEMLTGQPPFDAGQLLELRHMHLMAPPPRLSDRGVEAAPELETIIARALAKEPAGRFASADEMSAALARLPGSESGAQEAAAAAVAGALRASRRPADELSGGTGGKPVAGRGAGGKTTFSSSTGERAAEPSVERRAAAAGPAPRGRRVLRVAMTVALAGAGVTAAALWLTPGRTPEADQSRPAMGNHAPVPPPMVPVVKSASPPAPAAAVAPAAPPAAEQGLYLRVRSQPAGATVMDEDSGQSLGRTPLELRFDPGKEPRRVRVSKRGYRPVSFETDDGVSGDDGGRRRAGQPRQLHKDVTLSPAPRPPPKAAPPPPQGDIVL